MNVEEAVKLSPSPDKKKIEELEKRSKRLVTALKTTSAVAIAALLALGIAWVAREDSPRQAAGPVKNPPQKAPVEPKNPPERLQPVQELNDPIQNIDKQLVQGIRGGPFRPNTPLPKEAAVGWTGFDGEDELFEVTIRIRKIEVHGFGVVDVIDDKGDRYCLGHKKPEDFKPGEQIRILCFAGREDLHHVRAIGRDVRESLVKEIEFCVARIQESDLKDSFFFYDAKGEHFCFSRNGVERFFGKKEVKVGDVLLLSVHKDAGERVHNARRKKR